MSLKRLRHAASLYPDSYEEAPWGGLVVKVRKKVFAFLGTGKSDDGLSVGLKLPMSAVDALKNDWAEPMAYGMGKHGWVSIRFDAAQEVPWPVLLDWLDESFRAVAPKSVVKQLPAHGPPAPVSAAPSEPAEPRDLSVLLVGDDPLRLQRAEAALSAQGVAVQCVELGDVALDAAGEGVPDVVVLDACRNRVDALKLAGELTAVAHGSRMLVVGLRDLKTERLVADALGEVETSREAPGDPKMVRLILE